MAYIYYILIESPFCNVFRLICPSESIAPNQKKPKPENNNNSLGARDLNGFAVDSYLSTTVNGSVNHMSELSKL